MKVKLTQTVFGLAVKGGKPKDRGPGEVVDVDAALGKAMIESGQATKVSRGAAKTGPEETR